MTLRELEFRRDEIKKQETLMRADMNSLRRRMTSFAASRRALEKQIREITGEKI